MKMNMIILPLIAAILLCSTVHGQPDQLPNLDNTSAIYGIIKSATSGTVTPILSKSTITQVTSGTTNPAASWSEKPLEAQIAAEGGAPQTMALKLNLSQSLSQGLGQTTSSASGQKQSAVLQFSQYYKMTPQAPSKPLTSPAKYELTQEPAMLYFGGAGPQKTLTYFQYQSYMMNTGQNSLWILGPTSWTQYADVPQGASLSLLAISPSGGYGYLYEIYPGGTTVDMEGNYFYPYDQIGFYADQIGQHLLMFVIDGQPSNVVVIDVEAYQPPTPIYNYASITVSSSWLRGYDVLIDNSYQATEGTTGEAPGVVSFVVPGDQYHTVTIQGSGFSYSDYRYFNAGWAYTLTV